MKIPTQLQERGTATPLQVTLCYIPSAENKMLCDQIGIRKHDLCDLEASLVRPLSPITPCAHNLGCQLMSCCHGCHHFISLVPLGVPLGVAIA